MMRVLMKPMSISIAAEPACGPSGGKLLAVHGNHSVPPDARGHYRQSFFARRALESSCDAQEDMKPRSAGEISLPSVPPDTVARIADGAGLDLLLTAAAFRDALVGVSAAYFLDADQ
jgi:hypothetical protein